MQRDMKRLPSHPKILLVLPEVFEVNGGIQMFCRALCLAATRWARQNGGSVRAIVLNDSVAPDSRYLDGCDSFTAAGARKVKFIKSYLREVLVFKPDIILVGHLSLSPLLLASGAKVNRRRFVVIHGIEAWKKLPLLHRRAIAKADAALAVSDYTKNEFVRHNRIDPKLVKIFPCTLDPLWNPQQLQLEDNERPVLLTVCRLNKADAFKGVDSVIRALPCVIERLGSLEYRIVGSGDDLPRLRALANQLNVSEYVRFIGSASDEELRELYRGCSMFVLPSEKEGFGIVFLEAMAYAKPVVAGAHGGTPSVVIEGETGLLVQREETGQIAEAICRLVGDSELSNRLGRAGYERLAEHFTFERFEANLDEVFRDHFRAPAPALSAVEAGTVAAHPPIKGSVVSSDF